MVKKFKVLRENLKSPFQNFQYEIGKDYTCKDFDESDKKCSSGFYATDLEGIIYSFKKGMKVFEVEMSGREIKFDQFKHRWEKQRIIREITEEELKKLLKNECENVGYNILEACFPVNPLTGEAKEVTDKEIELLKEWISIFNSIRDSIHDSIHDSIYDSIRDPDIFDSIFNSIFNSIHDSIHDSILFSIYIRDSIHDSIFNSIRDSIRDSIYTYISSLFLNIRTWKYIDHDEGINPFQPGIDLWKSGFVPSFDGANWRLHSGNGKIVYEMGI